MTGSEYRPMADKRLRDRVLFAVVRTRAGRWLFTGPFARLDAIIMPLTKGRLQLAVGSPVLLLRCRGAKSGQLRVNPLLYTPRGDQMIIVASKAGHEKHPAWYHNLRAHPDVEVEIRGKRHTVRARVLEGEERTETWAYISDHFDGYDRYQSLVTREIPVVLLEPRDS